MPSFPIVDTHVHFWDTDEVAVDWLQGAPSLNRRFGPEDLTEHADPVEIESLVFVEADVAPGEHVKEARWVASLAATDPRIKAIVAHAPLDAGAVAAKDLDALAAIPLVRGIRRLLQQEEDDAFCLRPDFLAGVKLLPSFDMHFEICIYHHQFANVLTFVERCPEVRFVFNHIGKPGIKAGIREPWMSQMKDLADFDNVICKLSGVATEADHGKWTEDQLRPYMDRALECFGPDRIMFGGDWPVATLAIAYPRWVALVDQALSGLTEEQQRRVFRDTAISVYGL